MKKYMYTLMFLGLMTLVPIKEEVTLQTKEHNRVAVIPDYDHIKSLGPVVFNNLTEYQLIDQINASLNSDISNKGSLIVSKSLELGVDPYLATAIILHETGCTWSCSTLVKQCNNVGGMKGSPGCNGGSYKSFSSLDEGIISYIEMLDKYYIEKGLNTPELMNSKYAASTSWAYKVNLYIEDIKKN